MHCYYSVLLASFKYALKVSKIYKTLMIVGFTLLNLSSYDIRTLATIKGLHQHRELSVNTEEFSSIKLTYCIIQICPYYS